jgi:predicted metal-dependent hydrolase
MDIQIKRSMRKSIAVQVKDSQIIVKAPFFVTKSTIIEFVDKHKIWIETRLLTQKKTLIKIDKLTEYKQQARDYIPNRVKEIAEKY